MQLAALGTAGSVLANDTDSDSDALTATVGSFTAGASVTVNADGSFLYLPPAGFSGNDTFTYIVNDGHGHNVTGTVTIHVIKRVLYVKNNGGGSTGAAGTSRPSGAKPGQAEWEKRFPAMRGRVPTGG